MAGAATAGAAATGLRTWIFAWAGAWLTPRRRVYLTRALVAAGLVAAALVGPTA